MKLLATSLGFFGFGSGFGSVGYSLQDSTFRAAHDYTPLAFQVATLLPNREELTHGGDPGVSRAEEVDSRPMLHGSLPATPTARHFRSPPVQA